MTDIEIRLKCLELVMGGWDFDLNDIRVGHPVFKEAEITYKWVTKKQKKDEKELIEKVRDTEKALRSFNEV